MRACGDWPAHRLGVPRAEQRVHQGREDRLGHAVELKQIDPEPLLELRDLGRGDVLREDHDAQLVHVVGIGDRLSEQHPDRSGEKAGDRRSGGQRLLRPSAGTEPGVSATEAPETKADMVE